MFERETKKAWNDPVALENIYNALTCAMQIARGASQFNLSVEIRKEREKVDERVCELLKPADLGMCIMDCGRPATVWGGPKNPLFRMCCWSCKPRPAGWPGSVEAERQIRMGR